MRIGILGGTFNPVHNGHLHMAFVALEELDLDRILLMPNHVPPHKDAQGRDVDAVLDMLHLAFQGEPAVEISTYELEKGGTSYTVRTLEHFHGAYPEDELYFVIGEDSFLQFPSWRNPERILELATLVVFQRKSREEHRRREVEAFMDARKGRVRFIDSLHLEIASSDIRRRVMEGRRIQYLVPDKVAAYIEEKGLYREKHVD